MSKHIVITGNVVDGSFFYGPFDTADEAGEWAAVEHSDREWWIASLEDPITVADMNYWIGDGDA